MDLYIPNGDVRFIKNLDLDNTYQNTLYFDNKEQQTNFFLSRSDISIYDCNTIKESQAFRVDGNVSTYYNYNYIMFRNTHFTGKWFYAFITDVVYIAESVTEIHYELDVMQTWYFDITQKDSYIEREHTKSDNLFEHLIKEDFEALPTEIVDETPILTLNRDELVVVVYSSEKKLTDKDNAGFLHFSDPGIYGGTYVGSYIQIYKLVDFKVVVEILQAQGNIDALISVFLFPHKFLSFVGSVEELDPFADNLLESDAITQTYYPKISYGVDDYKPRNNKMLQHPYNFSSIVGRDGNFDIQYQFMEFDNNVYNTKVEIVLPLNPQPVGKVYVSNYRGVKYDYETTINISGLPLVPYNYSMYINEYNANRFQNQVMVLNRRRDLIAGAFDLSKGSVGGVMNAMSNSAMRIAQLGDEFDRPSTSVNQQSGSDSYLSMQDKKGLNITEQRTMFKKEHFMMVDEFFTKYGYKTLRTGVLSYRNRSNFTYVKTIECNFVGDFDVNTKNQIKSIFNEGITFWVNSDEIGNYSVLNSPISGGWDGVVLEPGGTDSSDGGSGDGDTGDAGDPMNDTDYELLRIEFEKHLGKPYDGVNGDGPDRFDCSGLTKWVFEKALGITIPRTAQAQYDFSSKVLDNQRSRGDLVFFQGTTDSDRVVTHVGIYIGNDQMIHAGDPVSYTNLSSSYWQNHLYGYGRVV